MRMKYGEIWGRNMGTDGKFPRVSLRTNQKLQERFVCPQVSQERSSVPKFRKFPDSHSIHRVSRSLPRLDSAFQHLDVGKALLLIFRCLTDSAGFARST